MPDRDRQLIDECLSGRSDAFAELIEPYQDRLYNALYRLTGHGEDAAELFQESMIRVYRGLGSYQGGSAFYTWLYRIVLNVAFTHRRRTKAPMVQVDAGHPAGRFDIAEDSSASRPGRQVELDETRDIIEQALAQVAEPYRVVLVLKDIEEFKYEEIAEILDVPVGTVRSRLHRARCEMRDRLQPYLDNGTI